MFETLLPQPLKRLSVSTSNSLLRSKNLMRSGITQNQSHNLQTLIQTTRHPQRDTVLLSQKPSQLKFGASSLDGMPSDFKHFMNAALANTVEEFATALSPLEGQEGLLDIKTINSKRIADIFDELEAEKEIDIIRRMEKMTSKQKFAYAASVPEIPKAKIFHVETDLRELLLEKIQHLEKYDADLITELEVIKK